MTRPFITLALVAAISIYFIATRGGDLSDTVDPVISAPGSAMHATMTNDLRTLVNVQRMYETLQGTYAGGISDLEFSPSADVSVRIITASAVGFSAEATHPGLPAGSCVVFVGTVSPPTTRGGVLASTAGTAVCDR